MYRTHTCGELRSSHISKTVTLSGWIQRRRDFGGLSFIDLRDRYGLTQLSFNEQEDASTLQMARGLQREYVVQITGVVVAREKVNANLATGDVEIKVSNIVVLSQSQTPPFTIEDQSDGGEELRMTYRYLDIRRKPVRDKLLLRHRISTLVRDYLNGQGFVDVETPFLIKSTPEGARDFVVPSRMNQGQFYALPQSPQTFKQLLMIGGMDRYYQIVRCFRDEDLRADRQPEFTQIDVEASFMDEAQIMAVMEKLISDVFKKHLDVDLGVFPRMPHAQAMHRFGSDKPDLRIDLELVDIADLMKDVEFKVFSGPANDEQSRVAALRVPQGANISRKVIDEYTKFVGIYGAKGLALVKVNDIDAGLEGLQSPILKFMPDEVVHALMKKLEAQTGDIIFFGADKAKVVNEALGALRIKVAEDLGQIKEGWAPLWVVDFPMFETASDGSLTSLHHPFTAPSCDAKQLKADPLGALSRAYDMVLNGTELGGGSIRINKVEMQQSVFEVLGIGEEEAQEKFGFLLEALSYGCPPHGGIAFGLDRLIMLMTGATSIRDVIAFPKTQSAACPLTDAPGNVSAKQLKELNIRLREQAAPKQP